MPKVTSQPLTKLGDILLKYHLITPEQLTEALSEQKSSKKRLGAILIHKGWVSEDDVNFVLGQQLDIPYVQLTTDMIDESLVRSIPREILERYMALPLIRVNDELTIVMADPTDREAISDLATVTKCKIQTSLAKSSSIRQVFENIFGPLDSTTTGSMVSDSDTPSPGSLDFFHDHVAHAIAAHATEIHFEPTHQNVRIRYRLDDQLVQKETLSLASYPPFVSRIKILFRFDLTKQNIFYSGIIPFQWGEHIIQLESVILPTHFGEAITLRIRKPAETPIPLKELGLNEDFSKKVLPLLKRSNGVILITGHSDWVSTQLSYSLLNKINSRERKVITIEKTLTCSNDNYVQIATEATKGLNTTDAFNNAISQGADVLLVDLSNSIPMINSLFEASVRNKLILGNMVYRDASEVIGCLRDSHVKPFLLSSYLLAIISVTQFRALCPSCKKIITLKNHNSKSTSKKRKNYYHSKGCDKCHHLGYIGHENLFEAFIVTPDIKKLILKGEDTEQILKTAGKHGFTSQQNLALEKAEQGIISIEEVYQKFGDVDL